jgi:hypothetical protein
MRKIAYFLIVLGIIALACGTSRPVQPTTDVSALVAQTMMAYTLEAALTQVAGQSQSAPPAAQPTPEEIAPDPLPAGYTGVILNNGECFDLDTGAVSAPDLRCDVWLTQSGLYSQMNGAQISGYVTMEAPSRTNCVAARFDPGDLAVQTDLFSCFLTDEGQVGFIVAREYRGGIPSTGIVFDYWVFR